MKQASSFSYLFLAMLALIFSACVGTVSQPNTPENTPLISRVPTQVVQQPDKTPVGQPLPIPSESSKMKKEPRVPTQTPGVGSEPIRNFDIPEGLTAPPYLMYTKILNDEEQIVLVNQDGSGFKSIPIPDHGLHSGNPSPTGEWIVYYTGSNDGAAGDEIPDLALNLMHLPDGQTHKVTDLLSDGHPANLKKIAELAQSNEPEEFAGIPFDQLLSIIQENFTASLFQAAWSPSGEVLAFSGATDGPSSDLYLYDLQSENITRLSSGSKNIYFIRWFPKGDQILYSSSYPIPCIGDCSTYYVTNLNGSVSSEIRNFNTYGGATFWGDWATDTAALVHTAANVWGICCLRNFDFASDTENVLYGDSFETYAYDPKSNLLALAIQNSVVETREPGVYFADLNGFRKVGEFSPVYYLGWPEYPFILSGENTRLLSATGETKPLYEKGLIPFASRNNHYVALCDGEWSQGRNGLKVFDPRGDQILDVPDQNISKVIWRLDSEGLFYTTGNQLFYISLQEKTPVLIDAHINNREEYTPYTVFGWVR